MTLLFKGSAFKKLSPSEKATARRAEALFVRNPKAARDLVGDVASKAERAGHADVAKIFDAAWRYTWEAQGLKKPASKRKTSTRRRSKR